MPRPGRRDWYDFPRNGRCDACGRRGLRQAHHVVREQDLERIAPGRVYDVANRMLLGTRCCHYGHHQYGVNDTRVPRTKIPARALRFAREVLGASADDYLRRHYRPAEA